MAQEAERPMRRAESGTLMRGFPPCQEASEVADCGEGSARLVWLPDRLGVEAPLLALLDVCFE